MNFPARILAPSLVAWWLTLGSVALADTAGVLSQGTTAYPSAGMRRVNKITLSNPLYRGMYLGLIDEPRGYAYFTSAGSVNPGWFVKVNIQGDVPWEVGADHGGTNEAIFIAGVLDSELGYAYVGTTMSPYKIVRFALGIGDTPPTYAGSIALAAGATTPAGAVLDTTDPAHHFAYFACIGSPGRIVKIALETFTEVAALTLSGPGESALRRAVFDPVNRCAYFATIGTAATARIVKIRCTDGSAPPEYIGQCEIEATRLGSVAMDFAGGYALFGAYYPGVVPAKVYKVRLNGTAPPTFVSAMPMGAGERELCSAVVDPVAGCGFFGEDHMYPGRIFKVRFGAGDSMPVEIGALLLESGSQPNPADGSNVINSPPTLYGEVFLQSAVRDSAKGYAYFGTDSSPGQIVKVALGHQGAIKATRVSLPVSGYVADAKFYCHAAVGNVRLAIYNDANPRALVWQCAPLPAAVGWLSAPAPLKLAAGTHWLAWQLDNGADVPGYVAGAAGDGFRIESAFGAFPASIAGATSTAETWAMHITYTHGIEGWRAFHFGTAANTPPAADLADADGDGFANLAEYALATGPLAPAAAPLLQAAIAGGRLVVTFPHDADADDIALTVEASDDLLIWSPIATKAGTAAWSPIAGATVGETAGLVTVTDAAAGARRFARVRVTRM